MITIIDVIKEMGIEPTPELTWTAGPLIRNLYEKKEGRVPEKALRAKTNGGGSHCFAIYPDWMKDTIRVVVLGLERRKSDQGDFFR